MTLEISCNLKKKNSNTYKNMETKQHAIKLPVDYRINLKKIT